MSAEHFLAGLEDQGIRFWLEDDRLHFDAPAGLFTPELRGELKSRKAEIVELLEARARETDEMSIPPRDDPVESPLSFAQQRLWFFDRLTGGSTLYNIVRVARVTGPLAAAALARAVAALAGRHESLRTTFAETSGDPVQRIAGTSTVELAVEDLTGLDPDERESRVTGLSSEEYAQPFDLVRGPIMRVKLLRLADEDHALAIAMHHIVSDGWSMGVLFRELAELYAAELQTRASRLASLETHYADFAVWQHAQLAGPKLEKQLDYWKQALGNLPALQLPEDHPRPQTQTFDGAYVARELSAKLSGKLHDVSRKSGATPFMVLLAAFVLLLRRYTGQDDIVVGSPIANRNRAELEGLIGFFVNSLVMRTDLSGNPSFTELVGRVRETALGAYEHQDVPFEKLVDELQPKRDPSRNPLFQVMFAMQNAPLRPLKLCGAHVEILDQDVATTRFDLELHAVEEAGRLSLSLIYNTRLYDTSTVERMLGHYVRLLDAAVERPDARLSDLPMLSDAEHSQVVEDWNRTVTDYPQATVHSLFAEPAGDGALAVCRAGRGHAGGGCGALQRR